MNIPVEIVNLGYIIASILFIVGLKMLSKAGTARNGNAVSFFGMLLAIVVTMLSQGLNIAWILLGIGIGSVVGLTAALKVKMTSMPEMVALFNGFGGLASALVGWAAFHQEPTAPWFTLFAVFFAIIIGSICFSGSFIAYAKLSGSITGKPLLYKGQQIVNILIVLAVLVGGYLFVSGPGPLNINVVFYGILGLSVILGVLLVIAIGGADMPVVISLLNSYSGLAACAAGFVILNNVLIVSGALVGASGFILTNIMCRAMNRSLGNVLFSGFGAVTNKSTQTEEHGEAKAASIEDAYTVLEAARSVVMVPGYGMAVAQAQHAVHELATMLEKNGTEVRYAIHPVAGRMPGHMNVLLAEANVPYEQLAEMDDINPIIETIDVCIVIGANDVVNPAARENESSPIYGMPVINVDKARTVYVLKRSMNPGFAGIENPLFFKENTRMIFGDAKTSIQALVAEFKET